MADDKMDWVDKQEEKIAEDRSKDYFNVEEGSQQFVLLSHCAPLAQVWDNGAKKYRPAEEGERNVSIKGVCWVLQDGLIKQAKLPYTVVKSIKSFRDNDDWEFAIPFPHTFMLTAKNAGTKEVEYTLNASPKKIEIPQATLDELAKKPAPEDIVERIKGGGKVSQGNNTQDEQEAPPVSAYPTAESEGINPADTPF